jgi:hypothetical protein
MTNIDNFVRDNPILHDVWVQVMAGGEAKGRAGGEARGIRLAIQRMLEARFSPPSQEMLAALQAADLPRLEHIATYASTDMLDQVRLRLGLSASQ